MNRRPSSFAKFASLVLALGLCGMPVVVAAEDDGPMTHAAMVDASILEALDAFLADTPIVSEYVGMCVDEEAAHGDLVGRLLLERLTGMGHVVRGPAPEDCEAVGDSAVVLRLAVNELVLRTRGDGRSLLGGERIRRECRVTLSLGVVLDGAVVHQERRSATKTDVVEESELAALEGGSIRAVGIEPESPWILEPLITAVVSGGMFYLFFTSRDDE